MAKAPSPPPAAEAAAPAAAPAPRRGKKLLMLIIIGVVVVALLVAGVVAVLLLKKGSHKDEAAEEQKPAAATAVDLSKPPNFVTLEPFVVNLAPAEGDRYLQVVLALRVDDHKVAESLKAFMPAIRHQINLLLSSKLPSELATPDGRENLASEILARTNTVLGAPAPAKGQEKSAAPAGPIQAVMFNSFIIQ